MTTAYLASEGYEDKLADELALAGVGVTSRHRRLFVADERVDAAWAINTWFDAERISISSIGDAARALRSRQRNWALYAPDHRGRAELIAQRLPHVSAKPLLVGARAPAAPLGSWTLLAPDLLLASTRCSSPFPNGEPRFVEDRDGPPSRAYLKLWEALVRLDRWPSAGDVCLDLGASPGGWTWLLAQCGARVIAVDKAPLDPRVSGLANVEWRTDSAFALEPSAFDHLDWLCSDVIGYPRRLLSLVDRWQQSDRVRNMVVTVKFQGETDHGLARAFAALPGARLFHLHNNRHELTFAIVEDEDAPATGAC
ncbi:MAG TPA: SAM-dependent methyltransferase [Acidimicrobiales bacterium]|nr:SAM-dependent methyltransferase [Acidimicrobiales bacterium]